MLLASASAEVESIVETFSGQGSHDGLDNPGWTIRGEGELTERGYAFEIRRDGIEDFGESLRREVEGVGSFVQRLVIRDLTLPEIDIFNTPLQGGIVSYNNFGPFGPWDLTGFSWKLEDAVETEDPYWEFIAGALHASPPAGDKAPGSGFGRCIYPPYGKPPSQTCG